jgi:RimJ/RimL family protein N-acetyltransferase
MGDPRMMEHLGGPESDEQIRGRLQRYIDSAGPAGRMFKILDADSGEAVGSVGYWDRTWQGQEIYETGWSVLPAFQGRGIAVAATSLAIDKARTEEKHRFIHAFPSTENAPSNAICRRLGFTLEGTHDLEYPPGNQLRCNDWRLDLGP